MTEVPLPYLVNLGIVLAILALSGLVCWDLRLLTLLACLLSVGLLQGSDPGYVSPYACSGSSGRFCDRCSASSR